MTFHHTATRGPSDAQAALYEQIQRAIEQIVTTALTEGRAFDAPVPPVWLAAPRLARADAPRNRLATLTAREREVLQRIASGDRNKAIARSLGLSVHTVKRHVANILDKTGAPSRGHAAAWLHAQG